MRGRNVSDIAQWARGIAALAAWLTALGSAAAESPPRPPTQADLAHLERAFSERREIYINSVVDRNCDQVHFDQHLMSEAAFLAQQSKLIGGAKAAEQPTHTED